MMKKLLFGCIVLSLIISSVNGQTPKIGHVDYSYIYENLPDYQSLTKEMEGQSKKYQELIESKYVDLRQKSAAYEKLVSDKASTVLIKDKETEISNLQRSIQELQSNSEGEVRASFEKKLAPIREKVDKAIDNFGRENNFTYIMRTEVYPASGESWPFLLYSSDSSNDVSVKVLAKMGITSPKPVGSKSAIGLSRYIK